MKTIAITLPPQAALQDLSRQLADIWALLSRGIGLWGSRERKTSLPLLTYTRTGRLVGRLQALLALLAAGRLPRSYPPRSSPAAATAGRPEDAAPPKPRPPRLHGRVGWLMAKGIEMRWAASQLTHWLADPAIREVLETVPQARKPLAALCRMLAIPPWPNPPDGPLPRPKPRVRKPRPPRAPRPTAAEERALLWHHRSIETDSGFYKRKRPWWLPPRRR